MIDLEKWKSLTIQWYLPLLILVGIFGLLGIQDGHSWGDDFALYLSQAQALIDGTSNELYSYNAWSVSHTTSLVGPNAYPPGYSLFLSWYLRIFGFSWVGLKVYQWLAFLSLAGFGLSFFRYFKKGLSAGWCFILGLITIGHPKVIEFSDRLYSDLFFLGLVLFFFRLLYHPAKDYRIQILLFLTVVLAITTRTVGIFLLAPWAVYLFFEKQYKAKDLIPMISAFLMGILFFVFNRQNDANHWASINPSHILHNGLLYFDLIGNYVFWHLRILPFIGWLIFFLLSGGFIYEVIKNFKRQAPLLVWIALNLIILLIWPSFQGARFAFTWIWLVVFISVQGYLRLFPIFLEKSLVKGALISILIVQASATVIYYRIHSNNDVETELAREFYTAIEVNTSAKHDVINFPKPRWLHYRTGRRCIYNHIKDSVQNSPATFLAIYNKDIYTGQDQAHFWDSQKNTNLVFRNAGFSIYRISKYSEQRNGSFTNR